MKREIGQLVDWLMRDRRLLREDLRDRIERAEEGWHVRGSGEEI